MFQTIAGRHFPKGSIKVRVKGTTIELGLYEARGKFFAFAFSGKRTRPDFHYSFSKLSGRDKYIADYIERTRHTERTKAARMIQRKAFRHSFKVGQIVSYSWGYDQTNVDFYQITKTTEASVYLRQICYKRAEAGSVSDMAEYVVAQPDVFVANTETLMKRPQTFDGEKEYIPMKHGIATLWNGQPMYCSWYH